MRRWKYLLFLAFVLTVGVVILVMFIDQLGNTYSGSPISTPVQHLESTSSRLYEFTVIEDGEVVVRREEHRYCSAKITETALWVTCFDSDDVHQSHIFRALEFKDLTK